MTVTCEPEQAVRFWLLADATVAGLVVDRMYPLKAPQQAVRPYLVYRRISGNPEHHMLGATALASVRLQIDALADSYAGARALAGACRMRLDGFRGPIVVSGTITFEARSITVEDSRDDLVDPTTGSDDGVYTASQDYLVFYVLPLPTL